MSSELPCSALGGRRALFGRVRPQAGIDLIVIAPEGRCGLIAVRALTFENLEGTGEQIANQILKQLLTNIKAAASAALRQSVEQAVSDAVEEKTEEVRQELK